MKLTRRDLLKFSAYTGAIIASAGLHGCGGSSSSSNDEEPKDTRSFAFNHGVASGDPLTDSVIIWTRVTPSAEGDVTVKWEVATDKAFTQLVNQDQAQIGADRDYTVKVEVQQLSAGTTYYYRFTAGTTTSAVGHTKTLPTGSVNQVKMAVFSCSNFPAGYFNVYEEAAKRTDLDVMVHLGDYIYEYARVDEDGKPAYASEKAAEMGREVLPANELLSLSDYRTRYAQYRGDESLQKAHANNAFIVVWDDHEIANDTYKEGAENHQDNEGSFDERKQAAIQAFFEWLPLRPITPDATGKIYRQFEFGDLVNLMMLDTRVIGRDKQLDYADYMTQSGLDAAKFTADVTSTSRSILGGVQRSWLLEKMNASTATWQVLGQQVLMARMLLPAVTLTPSPTAPTVTLPELGVIAAAAGKYQALLGQGVANTDEALKQAGMTDSELAIVRDGTKMSYLNSPKIPYNLDAWDGYAYDREVILGTAKATNKRLINLAGDTHNAWSSTLTDKDGNAVGTEFACSSVSSPGLEKYLNIPDAATARQMEASFPQLVTDLNYCNLRDRGVMLLTFTPAKATAEWLFVDTITSKTYSVDSSLSKTIEVNA